MSGPVLASRIATRPPRCTAVRRLILAAPPVRCADKEIVTDADHPDRPPLAYRPVLSGGSDLQLVGFAYALQLVTRPSSHQRLPTRSSDLIARRSSIAA